MHFVDVGAGDPVIMVHGNPTWSFYYRQLVSAISGQHRAIAVDHLGCGLSDKPAHAKYTLKKRIDDLSGLIRTLDLTNLTLVAHDWGGAIGLGALLQNRERFKKIVLLNTGAFPPPYIPFRIRICKTPLLGRIALQGMNMFARAAVTMATTRKGGLESNVAQGLLAPYDNWNNRRAVYEFVKDIPTRKSQETYHQLLDIENQLASLTSMSKLLIWGMQDWCFRPDCLDRFLKHWPEAKAVRIESAGHYVMEDAADTVVEQVRNFLSE